MDEPVLDRLESPDDPSAQNGSPAKPRTHTFHADGFDSLTVNLNDHISSITLLQLGAAVGLGEDAGNEFVTSVWEALTDVLATGELRRFKAWCKQTDPDMQKLVEMIGELIGKVSGRPFEEPQPLPTGRLETPTGSTVPGDAEPGTPPAQASPL